MNPLQHPSCLRLGVLFVPLLDPSLLRTYRIRDDFRGTLPGISFPIYFYSFSPFVLFVFFLCFNVSFLSLFQRIPGVADGRHRIVSTPFTALLCSTSISVVVLWSQTLCGISPLCRMNQHGHTGWGVLDVMSTGRKKFGLMLTTHTRQIMIQRKPHEA